nr:MORN repeat containing protein [Marseillevirus futianmevirus]
MRKQQEIFTKFFVKMLQTENIETDDQTSFETPKTISCGPAKGVSYKERVNKTKVGKYSVIKGTGVRHGPSLVTEEIEVISSVWSSIKQTVVERRTVSRFEIEKNYKNGKLDGEVFQKNLILNRRTGEMKLSLTVTRFYKDGVEYKDRVFGGPQGKKTEEWLAKRRATRD